MEQEFNKEQLADDYGKTWLGSDIAWLAAANGFLAGWDACEQKLKQCNVSGSLPPADELMQLIENNVPNI